MITVSENDYTIGLIYFEIELARLVAIDKTGKVFKARFLAKTLSESIFT